MAPSVSPLTSFANFTATSLQAPRPCNLAWEHQRSLPKELTLYNKVTLISHSAKACLSSAWFRSTTPAHGTSLSMSYLQAVCPTEVNFVFPPALTLAYLEVRKLMEVSRPFPHWPFALKPAGSQPQAISSLLYTPYPIRELSILLWGIRSTFMETRYYN